MQFAGRDAYRCALCHATADRPLPSCSSCGGNATYVSLSCTTAITHPNSLHVVPLPYRPAVSIGKPNARKARVEQLSAVPQVDVSRLLTIPAIDHVLGGEDVNGVIEPGIAVGSLVQIAGDPGAGKSTLLLQAMGAVASTGREVLYGTGEESASKVSLRAKRLGIFDGSQGEVASDHLGIIATRIIEEFMDEVRKRRPALAVYDSEQVAQSRAIEAATRSAQMVLYVVDQMFSLAHALGDTVIVLVCQMVKDGSAAGPLAVEHWTDASLMLSREGESKTIRMLSCKKNRDGPEHRVSRLAMTPGGLVACGEPPKADACNDSVLPTGADR